MRRFVQKTSCLVTLILLAALLPGRYGLVHAQVDNPFRDLRALEYAPGNTAQALEIRMQAMPGEPRRLVVVSLYNQSPGTNVIAAHVLEPPFDSGPVTFIDEIVTGPVFGLGDGCIFDDGVDRRLVFPFVQLSVGGDGILRTATFDGQQWDVISQSGPPTAIIDSGDCVRIGDKIFLSGHDTRQNRVIVTDSRQVSGINVQFGGSFCIGGVDSCLLGDSADTADDILGISQEAPRDQMIALTDTSGEGLLAFFTSTTVGAQLVAVDAAALPFPDAGDVEATPVPLPAPNRTSKREAIRGGEFEVRESNCLSLSDRVFYTQFVFWCAVSAPASKGGDRLTQYFLKYVSDGPSDDLTRFESSGTSGAFTLIELGPVNQSGPLGFTAPAVLPDSPLGVHGLWGEIVSVDASNQPADWYAYPAGWAEDGPAATCCEDPEDGVDGFLARSRPTGGVDFARFLRERIGRDGFESPPG